MITLENNNKIFNKISEMENEDCIFQVLQYDDLAGGSDLNTAIKISYLRQANIHLRQLRILLNDASVKIEGGKMSFFKGNIEMKNKIGGISGFGKKFFASKVTEEAMFKPSYYGRGQVFLEPTFGHFVLLQLEDETIIVDDGLFYACQEEVEVGISGQKSVSAALFGNETFFQTKLSGSGIVALEIPVPESEILKFKLINDVLKVDGNFAILRSGNIEFTVEKSSKSIVSTVTGGEGFVNVFRGTGEVWLMPTENIYQKIKNESYNLYNIISEQNNEEE